MPQRPTGRDYHCHRAEPASPNNKGFAVSRVIDGDTVEVIQNGNRDKVRLKEIDAPEMSQPGGSSLKKTTAETYQRKTGTAAGYRERQVPASPRRDLRRRKKHQQADGIARPRVGVHEIPDRSKLHRPGALGQERARRPLERREPCPTLGLEARQERHGPATERIRRLRCAKRYCREMGSCEEARHYLSQ